MHESGLAAAVAAALRKHDLGGARIRLLVTGGHGNELAEDAALRTHLLIAAPELDGAAIEIVHLPSPRACVACGTGFEASRSDAPCPACGGSALPVPTRETIEIELEHGDGTTG
jgi:Zn finger protein HypA/HybF involved in hydrogenase expression